MPLGKGLFLPFFAATALFLLNSCIDSGVEYIDARGNTELLGLAQLTDNDQKYQRPNCRIREYRSPLNLTDTPPLDGHQSSLQELESRLPDSVQVAMVPESTTESMKGSLHTDLRFSMAGINLCQYFGRLHVLSGESFADGHIPYSLPSADLSSLDWQENPQQWLADAAHKVKLDPRKVILYRSERCLYAENDTMKAAWDLSFYADSKPYQSLVVDGKVYEVEPRFFALEGNAHVYPYNKPSPDLVRVSLHHMQDNGFLCSDYVTTRVPITRPVAYSPDLNFSYPASDLRFKEVSAFASVARMWDWFLEKSPKNWAGTQVEVVLTNDPTRVQGGPVYENPDIRDVTRPTIYAPDVVGDPSTQEYSLTRTNTDFDAMAHELGHHILFQFVGLDSSMEHKALHEAIADFFVMAKTEDPCLAESICTGNSNLCVQKNKCLRSAENTLVFNGEEYDGLGASHHKKSQLITGFLWDLHKKGGLTLAYLGDLLFESIHYLSRKTNFQEFLKAIFTADKVLAEKKNACSIYQNAVERGFKDILGDFDCKNY